MSRWFAAILVLARPDLTVVSHGIDGDPVLLSYWSNLAGTICHVSLHQSGWESRTPWYRLPENIVPSRVVCSKACPMLEIILGQVETN